MGMTHKILFGFLFSACAVSAADFDVEALPEKLAGEVQRFFAADTGRARTQIAAFGDEDLQKITTAFKKAHPAAEQRLFWLIEESYRRNAERVAAERIRFLFMAVLAALGIIAVFTGLTYARARNLSPAAASAAPAAMPAVPAGQPSRRATVKKTKKGKRK